MKKIIERESKNCNKLYLYQDIEKELCYAYDFSAYLLTRLYNERGLKGMIDVEVGEIDSVCTTLQSVIDIFSNSEMMEMEVCDEFICVSIHDLRFCMQWRAEFNELKEQMANKRIGAYKNTTKSKGLLEKWSCFVLSKFCFFS